MICVYDPLAASYEGNGAAVLTPTDARVRQVAGGEYSFTMEHPMDLWGKWTHLQREAIVRLPVPAETIENSFTGIEADVYKANTSAALRAAASEPETIIYTAWASGTSYAVDSKVTHNNKNYQLMYELVGNEIYANPGALGTKWKGLPRMTSGSAVLVTLSSGTAVYWVESVDATWAKVTTTYGLTGYIKKSQLTYDHHATPSENQPRTITEQLFRIRDVSVNRDSGKVSVSGEHVSYDLNATIVPALQLSQTGAAMAVGQLSENIAGGYPGMIATNMTTGDVTYTQSEKRKNGMFWLTDPDRGIVSTFKAKFTRDNWDLFLMTNSHTDRGYRIRYAKNANGIQWRTRTDKLVTRVMPVAKAADGSDLLLPEMYVDSTHISDYPVIRIEAMNVQGQVGKDDGTNTDTKWTEETLLAEMRKRAGERYSVDKADVPVTEVTVQLEPLENTAEYAWLSDLLRVQLYDTVQVADPDLGFSETLSVTEIEYNCVRRKIAGVKMSSIEDGSVQRTVTGYNIANNSITADKLASGVITDAVNASFGETMGQVTQTEVTVVDNLTSTSTTAALSANQGKALKEITDGQPKFTKYSVSSSGTTKTHTLSGNSPFMVMVTKANSSLNENTGLYAGQAHTNSNIVTIHEPTTSSKPQVTISGKVISVKTATNNTVIVITEYPTT